MKRNETLSTEAVPSVGREIALETYRPTAMVEIRNKNKKHVISLCARVFLFTVNRRVILIVIAPKCFSTPKEVIVHFDENNRTLAQWSGGWEKNVSSKNICIKLFAEKSET